MRDKHQIIEEPCEGKLSRTVLKTNGIGDSLAEFNRTNFLPRSKTERRRSNSWAFYQLRTFLEYKGIKEGVEVIAIPPAYTSQTCHHCLHIGLRSNNSFKCGNCGYNGDADFNGAKMIELWGCSVNPPRGSELLSCAIEPGLPKSPSVISKPLGAANQVG